MILESKISKSYYNNLDNLEDNEQPYVKTLKQKEIGRVIDTYSKKRKSKKSKVLNHVGHLEKAYTNKAYTFVQDLEEDGVKNVKGVACKKQATVRVSTRHIC